MGQDREATKSLAERSGRAWRDFCARLSEEAAEESRAAAALAAAFYYAAASGTDRSLLTKMSQADNAREITAMTIEAASRMGASGREMSAVVGDLGRVAGRNPSVAGNVAGQMAESSSPGVGAAGMASARRRNMDNEFRWRRWRKRLLSRTRKARRGAVPGDREPDGE